MERVPTVPSCFAVVRSSTRPRGRRRGRGVAVDRHSKHHHVIRDSRDASTCAETRRGDAEERDTSVRAISARYMRRWRRKSRFLPVLKSCTV